MERTGNKFGEKKNKWYESDITNDEVANVNELGRKFSFWENFLWKRTENLK